MKSKQRTKQEEGDPGAPAWLVSFSDMVTLLLAFFVLLQSFAHTQDPELFFLGQGSFRRAIRGLGIPNIFLGKENKPELQYQKEKYSVEQDDKDPVQKRLIDRDALKIAEAFSAIQKAVKTQSREQEKLSITPYPTSIIFERGQIALNIAGEAEIRSLAESFGPVLKPNSEIYVMGMAADCEKIRDQWEISLGRARIVKKELEKALSPEAKDTEVKIVAWGQGGGEEIRKRLGLEPQKSFIVIVVSTKG